MSCPNNEIYLPYYSRCYILCRYTNANVDRNLPGAQTAGTDIRPAHQCVLFGQKHVLEKAECVQAGHGLSGFE